MLPVGRKMSLALKLHLRTSPVTPRLQAVNPHKGRAIALRSGEVFGWFEALGSIGLRTNRLQRAETAAQETNPPAPLTYFC